MTLSCFHYIHLHPVSLRNVLFQVVGTFASLITEIALYLTTFLCHLNFQHIPSFEDSRTIFTFKIPHQRTFSCESWCYCREWSDHTVCILLPCVSSCVCSNFFPLCISFCTAGKLARDHHVLLEGATSDPCRLELQSCI